MANKKDVKETKPKSSKKIIEKETPAKKDEVKKVSKTKEPKKVTSKNNATKKATSSKVSKNTNIVKSAPAKASSKTTKSSKVKNDTSKKTASKEVTTKKASTKIVEAKKATKTSKTAKTAKVSSAKRGTTKKVVKSKKSKIENEKTIKSTVKPMLEEYYDLPYRYNQTIVKILAQTPTTLFVYWDISDDDRNSLISKYGENFFYDTKPILIVHNLTKNYSFEIEINDFANSWYIRTQEPDSDYVIELGRKDFRKPEEYIYIYSSNNIISPNDHILFEKSDLGHVMFRNVKTGILSSKDFGSLRFINDIDKLYGNVYDVYSRLYKDETLDVLGNPSSGEFIIK